MILKPVSAWKIQVVNTNVKKWPLITDTVQNVAASAGYGSC